MKQYTINTYKYSELSEIAQQKAISEFSDINTEFEWWDFIYEDARNIGIKLDGFDIDRGNYCSGEFITNANDCANKILKEHGNMCETYLTASLFLDEYNQRFAGAEDGADGLQDFESDFLQSLLEDYKILLRSEYEHITSLQGIADTINANDYDFFEDGKFCTTSKYMTEVTEDKDTIVIKWTVEDVIQQGEDWEIYLTDNQAREVLQELKHAHDATIGINWDVIYWTIKAKNFPFIPHVTSTDTTEYKGIEYPCKDVVITIHGDVSKICVGTTELNEILLIDIEDSDSNNSEAQSIDDEFGFYVESEYFDFTDDDFAALVQKEINL